MRRIFYDKLPPLASNLLEVMVRWSYLLSIPSYERLRYPSTHGKLL